MEEHVCGNCVHFRLHYIRPVSYTHLKPIFSGAYGVDKSRRPIIRVCSPQERV